MATVWSILRSDFDEVSLADLVTFVLHVEEKEEDLGILWELVVNLVHHEVEVVVVDGRASSCSSLEGSRLDHALVYLLLPILVLEREGLKGEGDTFQ